MRAPPEDVGGWAVACLTPDGDAGIGASARRPGRATPVAGATAAAEAARTASRARAEDARVVLRGDRRGRVAERARDLPHGARRIAARRQVGEDAIRAALRDRGIHGSRSSAAGAGGDSPRPGERPPDATPPGGPRRAGRAA